MKVLIIDYYYTDFLSSFYLSHSENRTYNQLHKALMNQYFALSDAYSFNLNKLGCEAKEVIWNFQPLQDLWFKENSNGEISKRSRLNFNLGWKFGLPIPRLKRDNKEHLEFILLNQIKSFSPDVLYFQNVGKLSPALLDAARHHARLIVAQHATTFPDPGTIKFYDVIVSSIPDQVNKFRRLGMKSEYFPLGFDDRVLGKINKRPLFDVVHIGGYGPIHEERNKLLEGLTPAIPVRFWGYGVQNLSRKSPIRNKYKGEAWGLDMYNIRASSKVTVTKHITKVAGNCVNNCTLYEATGVGTCLVVDHKVNLREFFVPDEEVVTYSGVDDCVEKIKYLLNHEKERLDIAQAGQKRTLKDHTYYNRMRMLKEIIGKYL